MCRVCWNVNPRSVQRPTVKRRYLGVGNYVSFQYSKLCFDVDFHRNCSRFSSVLLAG